MITSAAHLNHILTYNPTTRVTVDQHYLIGDSIASAVGGDLAPSTRSANSGVAWNTYGDNDSAAAISTLTTTLAAVGDYSPIPYLAQRLFETTGRRSVWHLTAKASTSLVKNAQPTAHWDMRYLDSGNMLFKQDGTTDRSTIMPLSLGIRNRSPKFQIRDSFLHYAGGRTDAIALTAGTITSADYIAALNALLEYYKNTYGVSKLFIWSAGRIGNTAAAVASNQAIQDMAGIRAAQISAVSSNPNIHISFAHAHELGSPENTITVNANGEWESGFELQSDGAHFTQRSYDAVSYTAAKNIAAIIGE